MISSPFSECPFFCSTSAMASASTVKYLVTLSIFIPPTRVRCRFCQNALQENTFRLLLFPSTTFHQLLTSTTFVQTSGCRDLKRCRQPFDALKTVFPYVQTQNFAPLFLSLTLSFQFTIGRELTTGGGGGLTLSSCNADCCCVNIAPFGWPSLLMEICNPIN